MPSVRIRAPRTRHWVQVVSSSLLILVWFPAVMGWTGLSTSMRVVAGALLVLVLVMLATLLRGDDDVTADAEGLHRGLLQGPRLILWTRVTEVRPAPGRQDRIVFRGEDRRTLATGLMPGQREVDQLHTWHRAALEQARPGDTPDENGSGVHVND